MSDVPSDGLPPGLNLELDLSNVPSSHGALNTPHMPASAHRDAEAELTGEPLELAGHVAELAVGTPSATTLNSGVEAMEGAPAWSLELEDISPPPGASATRGAKAAHVAPRWTRPELSQPSEPAPVLTLELRIAQVVDRMSPLMRVSLLVFSVTAMLLFASAMLLAGTRRALNTVEELRRSAPAAVPRPGSAEAGRRRDPYEAYRVDHLVDVDDEGRHRQTR